MSAHLVMPGNGWIKEVAIIATMHVKHV